MLSSSAQSLPESPLANCPESPNCERETQVFDVSPSRLFDAAQQALADMGPSSMKPEADQRHIRAVYTVAFVFKDDVEVAVAGHAEGSVLHIRSASRTGYSDLGVNARRVNRFFDALGRHL